MTSRRILLSTVGTLGDVVPFARLAASLVARGHSVTVQSWPQFASWFPRDARFVAAGGSVTPDELAAGLDAALRAPTFVEQKRQFARMFYGIGASDDRARDGYVRATDHLANHDVAIINVLDHVTQLAADDAGIPWVSYASRPPPAETAADRVNAELDTMLSELFARVTGRSRQVRMFRERSRRLALAACSSALVPATLDTTGVVLTGAWLEPKQSSGALPDEVEAFLHGGPCLFATFGTMPDVFGRTAKLVEAAAHSGWRAIIQVLVPADLPPLPPGVLILRERVAFDVLVPRVAAVVHHGSVGTLHEVVRAARPSLIVAHMGDQFFWADALARRGASPRGVHHTEMSVPLLAERMAALHDESYARATALLAPQIAAEDGVANAVASIEEAFA